MIFYERVPIYSPLATIVQEQLRIKRDGPSRKVDHAEVRQDRLEKSRVVFHPGIASDYCDDQQARVNVLLSVLGTTGIIGASVEVLWVQFKLVRSKPRASYRVISINSPSLMILHPDGPIIYFETSLAQTQTQERRRAMGGAADQNRIVTQKYPDS
jgi:hypothetical protein